jgi:hypothetical protein
VKHALLIVAAAICASNSSAQVTSGQQWALSRLMMIDLVNKGYRVVAYQGNTTPASGTDTTTYLLQKDNSLFRYDERLMSYDSKTNKSKSLFICWELVKPFE